jgi:hypothetical protein
VSFDVIWLSLAEADLERIPPHGRDQVHALVGDIRRDPKGIGFPDPRPKADIMGRDRVATAGNAAVGYRVIDEPDEKVVYIASVRWRE